MVTRPLTDDELWDTVDAYKKSGSATAAARIIDRNEKTVRLRLREAARRGMLGTKPVLPGYRISKATTVTDESGKVVREFVQQAPESGEAFEVPLGHTIKGLSTLIDAEGRTVQQWVKTREDVANSLEAIKIAVDELKKKLPRIKPTPGPKHSNEKLLNQYTVTDLHFGMLAWAEETGDADYDLRIAEQLLLDWFSAAIAMSPKAQVGLLAQLGDLMHHDALESVTPAHKHVLDADSRLQKIIRVVIRVIRQIIAMMLQKYPQVHVIMASANHDPASSAWMRELLSSIYENEPRIKVDNSPDIYYAYEWGITALFYHHGHKRKVRNVDSVFAGKFREMFGRCEYCYGHVGHLHSDELFSSNLMKVERHNTLAPSDAFASSGGWLSKRDAKVITYHRDFGEVSRSIISPNMVNSK